MNLVATAPLWLLGLLVLALAAAAIEDAVRFRISNVICLLVLAGAVYAAVLAGPSIALWQNLAVFVVILVLGTAAFAGGLLGGGDVKLFAATALWFDWRSAIAFVALVFIAGGFVAIAYLTARLMRKRNDERRVPYGIAIGLGALALIAFERGLPANHERPLPKIATRLHGI